MKSNKVGNIIRTLRLEQNMTQKQLADKMNLSDKTISKWERGLGLPDISLISELAKLLEIDTQNLLTGDMTPNAFVGGNMKNTKYFICPTCQNVTLCTGAAEVSCCGKRLTFETMQKASESEKMSVQLIGKEWYITSDHPMTKSHYISFVALVAGDRIRIIKQYPEWHLNIHLTRFGHEMLIWYCTEHGLFYQLL